MRGDADDKALQFGRQPDLTAQPATRPHIVCEIEHVLFHRRWRTRPCFPRVIDIDMTGCTTAGAAAFGDDARHRVLYRRFHQRLARLALDRMNRTVVFYVSDFHHRTVRSLAGFII